MIQNGLRFVAALLLPMLVMPSWVGAAALATSPFEPPQRTASAVLMRALGVSDTVENFEGSFYGVSANVALNMNTRVAHVSLRGYPIAGTVEGDGWLKDSDKERGNVVLEPTFAARLARRFVYIQWASLNREKHTVTVSVSVPVIGSCELVLHRV
jgi:hypothetical protein